MTRSPEAMARTFRLEVVTPDRVVLTDDKVVSLTVPGAEGYLGILANHAPFFGELKVGVIFVRHEDGVERELATSGGFVEVGHNRVMLLVDSAEYGHEIDVERAEEAKRRAEERLAHAASSEIDAELARAALERALNRLRVAGKG